MFCFCVPPLGEGNGDKKNDETTEDEGLMSKEMIITLTWRVWGRGDALERTFEKIPNFAWHSRGKLHISYEEM